MNGLDVGFCIQLEVRRLSTLTDILVAMILSYPYGSGNRLLNETFSYLNACSIICWIGALKGSNTESAKGFWVIWPPEDESGGGLNWNVTFFCIVLKKLLVLLGGPKGS